MEEGWRMGSGCRKEGGHWGGGMKEWCQVIGSQQEENTVAEICNKILTKKSLKWKHAL